MQKNTQLKEKKKKLKHVVQIKCEVTWILHSTLKNATEDDSSQAENAETVNQTKYNLGYSKEEKKKYNKDIGLEWELVCVALMPNAKQKYQHNMRARNLKERGRSVRQRSIKEQTTHERQNRPYQWRKGSC